MWLHYLKTSWRNLKKNKLFSLLNIAGLAIGLTAAIMIFLWAENEYAYNKMFSTEDNVFLVENSHIFDGKVTTYKTTSPLLAPAMQKEIPQVQYAARSLFYPDILLSTEDKKIYEDGTYADASLFRMLHFQFLYGNAASALSNTNDIVLTQRVARSFFGNGNPVGKVLRINNVGVCKVSAVIRDLPQNASFHFTWIANINLFASDIEQETWTDNYLETYVKLNAHVNVADVNHLLADFIQKKDKAANAAPSLFSIRKLHLYNSFVDGAATNNGNIQYVRMFTMIGFIILLIACINFMNLSTARSQSRAKEISVRKVFGANRKSLIGQFLSEAFICTLLALILSLLLAFVLIPYFNRLTNSEIHFQLFTSVHVFALMTFLCGCTLVAGSYPAFYLSAFDPVKTLKQQSRSGLSALFIRKLLVVVQFSVCIVFVVATIVIYQQIGYTKGRDLGFHKNNIIYTPNSDYLKNTEFLRDKLMASGVVRSVAYGYDTPIGRYNSGSHFYWNGKDASKNVVISNTAISPGYLSTFGIRLVAGRDFSSNGTDRNSVIINETLAKLMGNEGRVGGRFVSGKSFSVIVGIVKDFVFDDMNTIANKPLTYTLDKEHYGKLFIALKPTRDTHHTVSIIQRIFDETYPSSLFQYKFLDEDFNQRFQDEAMVSRLSAVFGTLGILISCLGLFGLSSFMAEQRRMEIGIRKVLGASVMSITTLLSRDYFKLVLFACLAGVPVAWLIMHRWLGNYPYRINVRWWVLVSAVLLALLIAMVTVGAQTLKAARGNAIKSLKLE